MIEYITLTILIILAMVSILFMMNTYNQFNQIKENYSSRIRTSRAIDIPMDIADKYDIPYEIPDHINTNGVIARKEKEKNKEKFTKGGSLSEWDSIANVGTVNEDDN